MQTVSSVSIQVLQQLQTRGWKINPAGADQVAVTLAENFRNFVWTAQIPRPQGPEVVIYEFPKPREENNSNGDRIVLSRTLLISSENPLLDAAILEGRIAEGSHLLALTPTTVQLYQLQTSQWRLLQVQGLAREAVGSRDLRGRIVPDQGNSFDVFLPATHCNGVLASAFSVTCRQSDDPWPLSNDRRVLAFYAPSRNYYNGVISGFNGQSESVDPFYSAAILNDRILYSGLDGRTRMTVPGHSLAIAPTKWGSNIAAVQSACRTDVALATGTGDFIQADSLVAFRVSDSAVSAVSESLIFSGPVLNLVTSADRQQAIAIVLSSGHYEAYLLGARCGA